MNFNIALRSIWQPMGFIVLPYAITKAFWFLVMTSVGITLSIKSLGGVYLRIYSLMTA